MTPFASRQALRMGVALPILLAIFSVGIAIHRAANSGVDLHAIWAAAQAFWNGHDPYAIYLNYKLHGGAHPGYAPNYIPTFFLLIRPLFILGWPFVNAAFVTANVFLAIATIVLLCRLFLRDLPAIAIVWLACLLLASTPLRTLLEKGQVTLLVLFFFLLAYHFQERGRVGLATLCLAIAFLKYNITLPLALVFLRRDAIAAPIGAALIHGAVIAMAAAWLGESPWLLSQNMMRVNGYLLASGHVNYSNIFGTFGETGAHIGIAVSAVISLLAVLLMIFRRPADDLLALSLLSIVSLLVVYHGSYDMVMLIIPMGYVIREISTGDARSSPRMLQTGMVAIGLSTALLWYIVEFADALGSIRLGGHTFSGGPHVIFLWYILMIALTLALATFFVAAFNDPARRRRNPAVAVSFSA